MTDLAVDVGYDEGVAVLKVAGDLDMATAPALLNAAADLDLRTSCVVLDFTGVTFVDSTGIATAIKLEQQYGRVIVRNYSPATQRVFEVCGLSHLLG